MKMNKILMSLAVAVIMVISFLAAMPAEATVAPPSFLFRFGAGTWPVGIDADADGFIYVACAWYLGPSIGKYQADGTYNASWGTCDARGLAVDRTHGWVYVGAAGCNQVQRFDLNGNWNANWNGLTSAGPVAVDSTGSYVYVCCGGSVYKCDPNAPNGNPVLFGGGVVSGPDGIGVDSFGNVWVSCGDNYIREFNSSGGLLLTFGGPGSDDGKFNGPAGIDFDSQGNVYVTDVGNRRVQKFDSGGNFVLSWGNAGEMQFGTYVHDIVITSASPDKYYVMDESNGCVQVFGDYVPLPDLVVSKSVAFDEYGNFTVSYNVTNQGDGPADESVVAEYINSVNIETRGCPALGPSESHSDTFSAESCPDFSACGGTFEVKVHADDDDDIEESHEDNNWETNNITRPCPDLVLSKSVAFDEYGNFTVSYNITNQGTVWAGKSNTAKWVNGIWQESQYCPALGPGQNYSGAFSPEPCSDFCPCGGIFEVMVCADAWNTDVEESDEDNNCESNNITRPCPDLVLSKSVTIDEHGNFTVSYNITNQGTVWAGESNTAKWINGVWQESQYCPALGPGQNYSDAFDSEPCPCGKTLEVMVCADAWNTNVEESDEDNNCEMNVVECPCPEIMDPKQDSLYLDVDGDGAADPGDILQYVAEIRNEGNATASGVAFSDTVDTNTILMCAAPYAPIASQGSITSCNSAPGGSLAADLGDIGPKGVATVTFYVRIGYGEFDRVSNQGLVTGNNFADDPTDDPDTSELDDPTDTLISLPGPAPAPAVPTVNHWGIVAMISLFAALLAWRVRRRRLVS